MILDKFVEYLKVDYKLPKMDQVALPDFDAGEKFIKFFFIF